MPPDPFAEFRQPPRKRKKPRKKRRYKIREPQRPIASRASILVVTGVALAVVLILVVAILMRQR